MGVPEITTEPGTTRVESTGNEREPLTVKDPLKTTTELEGRERLPTATMSPTSTIAEEIVK